MSVLQFKRGVKANLPVSAAAGEPVWATDTRELFIGTGAGLIAVLPAGMIIMWSGLLTAIPAGWALCDGANGTPDLRSKFIKGSAAGVNPGVTGGAASASYTPAGTQGAPTISDHASHTHAITQSAFTTTKFTTSGSGTAAHTGGGVVTTPSAGPSAALSHSVSAPGTFAGTPATIPTEPPYFSLAFIMKL